MPKIVVGITGGALTAERVERQAPVRRALAAAGAASILVRPEEGVAALDRVAAVVLPGGGDVEPHRYGAPERAEVRLRDPERDEAELAVAREALRRGLPVLGICRGMQVLAVAAGGALVQHVPSLDGALAHEGDGCRHAVHVAAGSLLAALVGAEEIETNSSHHQATDGAPPGWAESAWTSDGVVEAIEGPAGLALGVQWHPERDATESGLRVLEGFVARAARAGS